jgi:hypothetical protein
MILADFYQDEGAALLNRYQTLNNGGSALIFAGVLAGAWKLIGDSDVTWNLVVEHADSIFLMVFIIFCRIKMHLDDHEYFENFDNIISNHKYWSLMVAVAVWFLMAFAAGTIKYPETSANILAIAFAICTVWIAVHLMSPAPVMPSLRHKWIIINMAYIVLLILYALDADILFTVRGIHFDLTKWGFIVLMIVVMISDHYITRRHPVQI